MPTRSLRRGLCVAALAFPAAGASPLTIAIEAEGFTASGSDIHAVCRSAADQLLVHMPDLEPVAVVVAKGEHGPIALFERGENGEYRVRLDTGGTYWSQYAYQFAHELCHVLCRYEDDYKGNLWFHLKWHRAVPAEHKDFVQTLAALFGVELP